MGRALVYGLVGMGLFVVLEFWGGGAVIELVCIMPDVSPKTPVSGAVLQIKVPKTTRPVVCDTEQTRWKSTSSCP